VGGVVALQDLAPDPPLAEQLADRAEEVVLQALSRPKRRCRTAQARPGAVAVVADEAAPEQAVALLDPGLVVLAVGPPAGEADAAVATPAEQGGVDELAPIVAVPFAQGEGEALGEMLDGTGLLYTGFEATPSVSVTLVLRAIAPCAFRPTRLYSRCATPPEEKAEGPPRRRLCVLPPRAIRPPPMKNCGGRYAPACQRPACLLSMVCRGPAEEPAVPASCAIVP